MIKYIAVISLFFFACKKEGTYRDILMKGIVLHAETLEPIRNQQVILWISIKKLVYDDPIEFPNGRPDYKTVIYQSLTGNNGRYEIPALVPNEKWSYSVTGSTGEYITTRVIGHILPYSEELIELSSWKDTILMERSGYVKYSINTMGSVWENEALYLHTPSTRKTNRPTNIPIGHPDYNYVLFGKVTTVINDTIPSDKVSRLEVKWLHSQFDTLHYKVDTILVEPWKTTQYSIQY